MWKVNMESYKTLRSVLLLLCFVMGKFSTYHHAGVEHQETVRHTLAGSLLVIHVCIFTTTNQEVTWVTSGLNWVCAVIGEPHRKLLFS